MRNISDELAARGPSAKPTPQARGRSPLAESLTLASMSLGVGVVQLDITIVNTALDVIGQSLGGGVSELQWVVNAYTIAFAAFILTGGALGDRIGARRVFMSGFVIFTAASLACALAPTAAMLIAARAVQGFAAALLMPNSLALLNHAYSDDKSRGKAVGIWAAGAALALTAGPFIGGALITVVGWRSIFLVNLPIGLAGLWLTWRWASETTRLPQREIDLPGQVLGVVALACLAGAIIEGGPLGWGTAPVLGGMLAAALCGAAFLWRERRATQPMLPLPLFRNRMFSVTSLTGLLVNVAFYGLIFIFSLYFQRINGLSPFETGLAFVPMVGVVLPVNLLAATIAERIGAPTTIAIGATLSASGCVAMFGIEAGTSYLALCAPLMVTGAGLGLLVPPLTSTLLGSVDKSRSGIAAGVLNAARQTGSVLGVAVFGSLVSNEQSFIEGMRASLVISALVMLAAAAIIFANRGYDRRGGSQAKPE